MARNGSGTMNPISNSWYPPVNGQLAASGDWQAIYLDLIAALTQSLSRDGQGPMTGNLQMGGNKITGQGAATGTGQSLTFEQLFDQGTEQDLAGAATTDIGAQLTNFLRITGTTTITSFGTNYKGPRFLRFAGAVLLTNSATLALPGGANITTAAGDCLIVVPKATLGAADGWQVVAYQSSSVKPLGNITAGKVLGRDTSGNGAVQELPISVDAAGNVGIGTSSPGVKLDVNGACNFGGSSGVRAGVGTAFVGGQAELYTQGAVSLGVGTASTQPLNFYTNGTERARIDSSGNLLVGTTSTFGGARAVIVASSAVQALTVANAATADSAVAIQVVKTGSTNSTSQRYIGFAYNGGGNGNGAIAGNGDSQATFITLSDERLKENIENLPPQLANVMALRPVEFDYKSTGGHQIGFIAQEVQAIYPDLVAEGDDGYLSLAGFDKNTARLIKAIQEQQALIIQLQADVAALKGN